MGTTVYAHSAIYIDPATGDLTRGPATITTNEGIITSIAPGTPDASAATEADAVLAQDETLIPGLVDTHVHVNEPGRTEWEGFASATRAAAAGGVTTLIDMPLNSIPSTTTMDTLRIKQDVAKDQVKINVGFWGGAVPENLGTGELQRLWDEGKVFGYKCFLIDSGVDEFQPLSPAQLEQAMTEIAAFDGQLIVHAESGGHVHADGIDNTYESFLNSRPPAAEQHAIEIAIAAAEKTGCRTHILHLSDAGSLDMIKQAQARGVKITAETCPHYLSLFAEEIYNGSTDKKCCPPIREASNREKLWAGLKDGIISLVVSDHSPCTAELKKFADALGPQNTYTAVEVPGLDLGGPLTGGSFDLAWGGISSVELGLPIVWTQARKRGLTLTDVIGWMSQAPAQFAGLQDRGAIEVGKRADFAAVKADSAFVVIPENLHHKNKVTAYAQHALSGLVTGTWIAGEQVFDRSKDGEEAFPAPAQPFTLRP